jgi:hypothetical protein
LQAHYHLVLAAETKAAKVPVQKAEPALKQVLTQVLAPIWVPAPMPEWIQLVWVALAPDPIWVLLLALPLAAELLLVVPVQRPVVQLPEEQQQEEQQQEALLLVGVQQPVELLLAELQPVAQLPVAQLRVVLQLVAELPVAVEQLVVSNQNIFKLKAGGLCTNGTSLLFLSGFNRYL